MLNGKYRFLGDMVPTTLAACIVAMTSAPDAHNDTDSDTREELVMAAWEALAGSIGVYGALKMMQERNCGVVAGVIDM